jgi:hypothetical protein
MSKKRTKSNKQIAQIVDREGLDYAVTAYMDSDDFEDRHLASLWDQAQVILDEITEILDEANPDGEV